MAFFIPWRKTGDYTNALKALADDEEEEERKRHPRRVRFKTPPSKKEPFWTPVLHNPDLTDPDLEIWAGLDEDQKQDIIDEESRLVLKYGKEKVLEMAQEASSWVSLLLARVEAAHRREQAQKLSLSQNAREESEKESTKTEVVSPSIFSKVGLKHTSFARRIQDDKEEVSSENDDGRSGSSGASVEWGFSRRSRGSGVSTEWGISPYDLKLTPLARRIQEDREEARKETSGIDLSSGDQRSQSSELGRSMGTTPRKRRPNLEDLLGETPHPEEITPMARKITSEDFLPETSQPAGEKEAKEIEKGLAEISVNGFPMIVGKAWAENEAWKGFDYVPRSEIRRFADMVLGTMEEAWQKDGTTSPLFDKVVEELLSWLFDDRGKDQFLSNLTNLLVLSVTLLFNFRLSLPSLSVSQMFMLTGAQIPSYGLEKIDVSWKENGWAVLSNMYEDVSRRYKEMHKRRNYRHNTSITGKGEWAKIAKERASFWTEFFQTRLKNGSAPTGYDGRVITPEEWNRGGDGDVHDLIQPDRNSHYVKFAKSEHIRKEKKEEAKEEKEEERTSAEPQLFWKTLEGVSPSTPGPKPSAPEETKAKTPRRKRVPLELLEGGSTATIPKRKKKRIPPDELTEGEVTEDIKHIEHEPAEPPPPPRALLMQSFKTIVRSGVEDIKPPLITEEEAKAKIARNKKKADESERSWMKIVGELPTRRETFKSYLEDLNKYRVAAIFPEDLLRMTSEAYSQGSPDPEFAEEHRVLLLLVLISSLLWVFTQPKKPPEGIFFSCGIMLYQLGYMLSHGSAYTMFEKRNKKNAGMLKNINKLRSIYPSEPALDAFAESVSPTGKAVLFPYFALPEGVKIDDTQSVRFLEAIYLDLYCLMTKNLGFEDVLEEIWMAKWSVKLSQAMESMFKKEMPFSFRDKTEEIYKNAIPLQEILPDLIAFLKRKQGKKFISQRSKAHLVNFFDE